MANTEFQLGAIAARLYEQYTVPTGARPSAELMLQHVALPAAAPVLDAAGMVTRLVAQRGGSVARIVGLDLNVAMLDVAQRRAREVDVAPGWAKPRRWRTKSGLKPDRWWDSRSAHPPAVGEPAPGPASRARLLPRT